ncbi:MAG: carboxypeptidase regulatory-like domain-containing protein [Planctomycetota bacterium]
MYRDVLSIPLEIECVDTDGEVLTEVICHLTMLDGPERVMLSNRKLKATSPEIRKAWRFDKEAPGRSANLIRPPVVEPLKKQRLYFPRVRLTVSANYRFEVTAEGGLLCEQTTWIDEGSNRIRLILEPGQTISGVVVDEDLGHAVEAVEVELEQPGFDEPLKMRTDAEGRFVFESLNPKSRNLSFKHESFQLKSMTGVLPGSDLTVNLKPFPRRDVRGRILVRGSEVPVENALIMIGRKMERVGERMNGGRFILPGIPKRSSERITVSAPGFIRLQTEIGAEVEEIEFFLTPDTPKGRLAAGLTSVLQGQVVSADGKPVPGIDLRLRVERESTSVPIGWSPSPAGVTRRAGLFSPPSVVTTDAEGRFTLESVHAGLAEISSMDRQGVGQTVHLQLGQSYEGLLIRIK